MLTGRLFKLRTQAIGVCDGRDGRLEPIIVPAGTILRVVSEGKSMVDVAFDGHHRVTVKIEELQRAEELFPS